MQRSEGASANGISMPFERIPTNTFFRVLSPESEYASEVLLCMHDEDLPKRIRAYEQTSFLFLVTNVDDPPRGGAKVYVEEIDFIDDSTVVESWLPVTPSANWPQVILVGSAIGEPISLARIDESGRLRAPKKRPRHRVLKAAP